MSSDIKERLRVADVGEAFIGQHGVECVQTELGLEAADRIEALEAEVAALKIQVQAEIDEQSRLQFLLQESGAKVRELLGAEKVLTWERKTIRELWAQHVEEITKQLDEAREDCARLLGERDDARDDVSAAEARAERLREALATIGEGIRDGQHCALIANTALEDDKQ